MKYTFRIDQFETHRFIDRELKPGVPVLVYSRENLMTGDEAFYISTVHAEEGYPGNLDDTTKCFHGWRGTYNNIRTEAHGVYTIKSVEAIGEYLKVTINRTDLKKNED